MNRKICVITGSRAEYGLLRWVMEEIRKTEGLVLQTIVTGAHLSPEFGLTYREIENDGFSIDRKNEMLLSSDTSVAIAKSMGVGMIGFADAYADLQPHVIVLLGDRYEILAAVAAALVARIPVAHLHGGERTDGAFDDAIRHAITKMSHLHFVATSEYRRRVLQLGEDPARVFLVGGLGVDAIKRTKLLERDVLESSLGFQFGTKNLLVTFHPVTLDQIDIKQQVQELLSALAELEDTHIIFTTPNADNESRLVTQMLGEFVSEHRNTCLVESLGQQRYYSCLNIVDGVVGNSSSGLLEVPSFCKGTINIGSRQNGRLKADSVIDCSPTRESIGNALMKLYSAEFQKQLLFTRNPYGDGGAAAKIVQVIRDQSLRSLCLKQFNDLSFQESALI